MCRLESAISTGQVAFPGRRECHERATRTACPSPQFGPLVPRPCKGATTSCFRPVPFTSPKRSRCSVGSSNAMGWTCQRPCWSRPSHWSVPGLLVSVGRQPAPSAKSMRPSPSMSCGWMHTLSRSVAFRTMSCLRQLGFSYQITASSVTTTTSSFWSPFTSAAVTA